MRVRQNPLISMVLAPVSVFLDVRVARCARERAATVSP